MSARRAPCKQQMAMTGGRGAGKMVGKLDTQETEKGARDTSSAAAGVRERRVLQMWSEGGRARAASRAPEPRASSSGRAATSYARRGRAAHPCAGSFSNLMPSGSTGLATVLRTRQSAAPSLRHSQLCLFVGPSVVTNSSNGKPWTMAVICLSMYRVVKPGYDGDSTTSSHSCADASRCHHATTRFDRRGRQRRRWAGRDSPRSSLRPGRC